MSGIVHSEVVAWLIGDPASERWGYLVGRILAVAVATVFWLRAKPERWK